MFVVIQRRLQTHDDVWEIKLWGTESFQPRQSSGSEHRHFLALKLHDLAEQSALICTLRNLGNCILVPTAVQEMCPRVALMATPGNMAVVNSYANPARKQASNRD